MKRAILWGAVAAILVSAIGVASLAVVLKPSEDEVLLSRVLVIATVPNDDGGDVAPIAFVLDDDGSSTQMDMLASKQVPGSSASNPAEAFPFGGGNVVAYALREDAGGDTLEWVVLPSETWASVIDRAGGIELEVPSSVGVYARGELTVLEPGARVLTGKEAVALVSAMDYLPSDDFRKVTAAIGRFLGAALAEKKPAVDTLVRSGTAQSSVEPNLLPIRKSTGSNPAK